MIDLAALNEKSISADRKVASVGPGATWANVVAYLDSYDVTVLAGRVPNVGVGDLVLGGSSNIAALTRHTQGRYAMLNVL